MLREKSEFMIPDPFVYSYKLDKIMLKRFNRAAYRNVSTKMRLLRVSPLLASCFLAVFISTYFYDGAYQQGMIAGVMLAFFFFFISLIVMGLIIAKFIAKHDTGTTLLDQVFEVTLSPEGITEIGEGFHKFIGWRNIETVLVVVDLVLIQVTHRSFLPVPNDALPKGVSREMMLDRITAWRTSAMLT